MSRTINRPPMQVHTPTSKEARNYFHNQYEWLGVNDDKNFVEVDQKYFQDANNVYVDTEGVLRSRPSLKIRTTSKGSDTLTNIDYIWKFNELVVYLSDGKLIFDDVNQTSYVQYTLITNTPTEVKLYKIRFYILTN